MEAYAAKAEADAMMEELKNQFIGEFGIAAWDQVLAHTTQIKKDQKAAALEAQKEWDQMMHDLVFWGSVFLSAILVISILVLVLLGVVRR